MYKNNVICLICYTQLTVESEGKMYSGKIFVSLIGTASTRLRHLVNVCIAHTRTLWDGSWIRHNWNTKRNLNYLILISNTYYIHTQQTLRYSQYMEVFCPKLFLQKCELQSQAKFPNTEFLNLPNVNLWKTYTNNLQPAKIHSDNCI